MIGILKMTLNFIKEALSIITSKEAIATGKFLAKAVTVLDPNKKNIKMIKNFTKAVKLVEEIAPYLTKEQTVTLCDRINKDNKIAFKGFVSEIVENMYGKGNDGLKLSYSGNLGSVSFDPKTKKLSANLK
ncbi:MAG: hypothetical protein GY710_03510 [Desulfobacteraceae bacterium]|nr:hypothetical protein [Desulfobacteraceae bacterium]